MVLSPAAAADGTGNADEGLTAVGALVVAYLLRLVSALEDSPASALCQLYPACPDAWVGGTVRRPVVEKAADDVDAVAVAACSLLSQTERFLHSGGLTEAARVSGVCTRLRVRVLPGPSDRLLRAAAAAVGGAVVAADDACVADVVVAGGCDAPVSPPLCAAGGVVLASDSGIFLKPGDSQPRSQFQSQSQSQSQRRSPSLPSPPPAKRLCLAQRQPSSAARSSSNSRASNRSAAADSKHANAAVPSQKTRKQHPKKAPPQARKPQQQGPPTAKTTPTAKQSKQAAAAAAAPASRLPAWFDAGVASPLEAAHFALASADGPLDAPLYLKVRNALLRDDAEKGAAPVAVRAARSHTLRGCPLPTVAAVHAFAERHALLRGDGDGAREVAASSEPALLLVDTPAGLRPAADAAPLSADEAVRAQRALRRAAQERRFFAGAARPSREVSWHTVACEAGRTPEECVAWFVSRGGGGGPSASKRAPSMHPKCVFEGGASRAPHRFAYVASLADSAGGTLLGQSLCKAEDSSGGGGHGGAPAASLPRVLAAALENAAAALGALEAAQGGASLSAAAASVGSGLPVPIAA